MLSFIYNFLDIYFFNGSSFEKNSKYHKIQNLNYYFLQLLYGIIL